MGPILPLIAILATAGSPPEEVRPLSEWCAFKACGANYDEALNKLRAARLKAGTDRTSDFRAWTANCGSFRVLEQWSKWTKTTRYFDEAGHLISVVFRECTGTYVYGAPRPACEFESRVELSSADSPEAHQDEVVEVGKRPANPDDFFKEIAIDTSSVYRVSDSPAPTAATLPSILVHMERTGCFGRCPAYELTVYSNGEIAYQGKTWVAVKGEHRARLTVHGLVTLVEAIEAARFFKLPTHYGSVVAITDVPYVDLTISLHGRQRQIVHANAGGDPDVAPQALLELERRIDAITGASRWIGSPSKL